MDSNRVFNSFLVIVWLFTSKKMEVSCHLKFGSCKCSQIMLNITCVLYSAFCWEPYDLWKAHFYVPSLLTVPAHSGWFSLHKLHSQHFSGRQELFFSFILSKVWNIEAKHVILFKPLSIKCTFLWLSCFQSNSMGFSFLFVIVCQVKILCIQNGFGVCSNPYF